MKKTLNVILFFLTCVSIYSNCSAMSSLFIEYLSEQSRNSVNYTTKQLTDTTDLPRTAEDEPLKKEEDRIANEKTAKKERLNTGEEELLKNAEITKQKVDDEIRLKNEETLKALFDNVSSLSSESSFEEISDYHSRVGYAVDHYEDGGERVIEHFLKYLDAINSDDHNLLRYKFYGKVMLAMMNQIGKRIDLFYKEKFNDVLFSIPVKINAREIHNNGNNVSDEITISLGWLLENFNELSGQTVIRKSLEEMLCKFGGNFLRAGKKASQREYQIQRIDINDIVNKIKPDKNTKKALLSIQ